MYGQITIALCIAACLNLAWAGPLSEDELTRNGMTSAFEAGSSKFGGRIGRRTYVTPENKPEEQKQHIYSLYTKDIVSPSGGKPALAEQYITNNYTPLAPVVVPKELPPSTGRETAAEAALRYVPKPPLQYTEDRLRV